MRPLLAGLVWVAMALFSTPTHAKPSSAVLADLERLQVVGSVLYVAAHPDDENTRLISWLVGERGFRVGYLSMTRGGGGQNLIGAEQAENLGVVRTGELLAARGVDGGSQLFTRMRDFGYSKSTDETLSRWGHDEALEDVVRAIRTFRPDVVVTRFSEEWGGHGHHTASAALAKEAFEKAGDAAYDTPGAAPWQPARLFHNTSTWRRGDDFVIPDEWLRIDVGTYDPLSGRSWGEVAADSRTMHKSQGFGSAPRLGPQTEYFTLTTAAKGTPPPTSDPFGGLSLDWSRFDGTSALERTLRRAAARFDPKAPEASLLLLAAAFEQTSAVPDPLWRAHVRERLTTLMEACAGLWLQARAETRAVAPDTNVQVKVTALLRRPVAARIRLSEQAPTPLAVHEPLEVELTLPTGSAVTQPHWLRAPPSPTRYTIVDPTLRTRADTPASLRIPVTLELAGASWVLELPVQHSRTDPVRGEVLRDVEVLPPVTATFGARRLVLPTDKPATVPLHIRATGAAADGQVRLEAPSGFRVSPSTVEVAFDDGLRETVVEVEVHATGNTPGVLVAKVDVGGRSWRMGETRIAHEHLPERTILAPAELPLVPVTLDRGAVQRVGYLQGSGDAVPEALRAVGYTVEEIDEERIRSGSLAAFDAVVFGIRAYNTRSSLPSLNDALMAYVAAGGTLLVQYNTSRRWGPLSDRIGPAKLDVGRGRVTDETADVSFVTPDHPALNRPHALGADDFSGWVQERGLYFVEEWDEDVYTPLLSMADPGEAPRSGSLLVARHGNGHFVYTGLSFFRQLPAGVPGAYRLFANLLALGAE